VAQHTEKAGALLDDSDAYFLGFQVHEIYRKGSFLVSVEKNHSIGHAGLGGSVLLTIPEASKADCCNKPPTSLTSARARNTLLDIIFWRSMV
jgi:hypothetical protein